MNYLLHIDTSGNTGTVAVSADGKLLANRSNEDTRNQAGFINIMINDLLSSVDISLHHLAAIVVCAGPGSYTGLRIGMATAKALCYVLDKPLLLHNKLTLLAHQQFVKEKNCGLYLGLLKAREREYFIAGYNNQFEEIIAPQHILETQISEILAPDQVISVATDINEDIIKNLITNPLGSIATSEIDLAVWANYAFDAYKCNESVNLSAAEPFYLKQAFLSK